MKLPDDPSSSSRALALTADLPPAATIETALQKCDFNPEHVETLLRFVEHGRALGCTSYGGLAALIKRSASTVSRILRGVYEADPTTLIGHIAHYLSVEARRADLGNEPLVQTSTLRKLSAFCENVRIDATMGVVTGANQSGKTWAFKAHAEATPRTYYVRMPAGGGTRMMLNRIAKAIGKSHRKSYDELRDTILAFFDPTCLLIVDELHQCMPPVARSLRTVTIETIREIFDECGCGIVLCGTDVVSSALENERMAALLSQISNRGVLRLRIPVEPRPEDISLLREAYGFPPLKKGSDAHRSIFEIGRTNGLGKLCKYFRKTRRLAMEQGATLSWDHFSATVATCEAEARGEGIEEEAK